jgi:hypothetical protein
MTPYAFIVCCLSAAFLAFAVKAGLTSKGPWACRCGRPTWVRCFCWVQHCKACCRARSSKLELPK